MHKRNKKVWEEYRPPKHDRATCTDVYCRKCSYEAYGFVARQDIHDKVRR